MAWQPVLGDALADDARRALRELADAIDAPIDGAAATDRSAVDRTLFWSYAAGTFDDDASAARLDAAATEMVADVEGGTASPALYGGLAGAGWVMCHVGDPGDQALAVIDGLMIELLAADDWRGDYDVISGLAGYGVYFLERLAGGAAPDAALGLARVIDHLARSAETGPDGTTWFTRPELLPDWQRERAPAGSYNCGVAHGVPGVAALLGRAAAAPGLAGAARARARELCVGATRWLHAQMLPANPHNRFPSNVIAGVAPEPSRTAWCYGDLGAAVALWHAAARIGEPVEPWRALVREVAARPAELCLIRDGGLCHGAFGLAHLFNRCYQASGEPELADAARRWFAHGLALRRPGEGIAGFTAVLPRGADQPPDHQTSASFLEGAAGIGLALIAGLAADEPGWDRLLACDLPPAG